MPSFSRKSQDNLSTCDIRLQQIFNEVVLYKDCTILEGYRGPERQEQLRLEGKSKAKFGQSMHNKSPSLAVDVMPYPIDWSDKGRLIEFAGFVQGIAAMMNVPVRWGGHWKSLYDGPHWEIK